ncbi:MarR family transcriptional regulator [Bacillus sp. AFS055030]|uniref:MarR family winged helix-turn-helix transcriptional regulator n=1 Tax=Bacillus sp. AFS055030 TaxID=2033507 RepID=UPI000BFBCF4B|nr:MarR family transcriptional regulator [Bacillus sp. AFS055030]PGL73196.1 MarR family transcriptional regulator [Bacillus sp. AFS055030]
MLTELHQKLSERGFDDLKPTHGFLFKCILPNGATGNELADKLGITKQAVSKMVDYLEERGYVKRHSHPTDKRGKTIVISERGQLAIKEKEEIVAELEKSFIQKIGSKRMDNLKEDLRKVVEIADEQKPTARIRPVW